METRKDTRTSALELYDRKKYSDAFAEFLKLAEDGDVACQNVVGNMYFSGKGVEKDAKKAFEWFTRAANNHHVDSLFSLGALHSSNRNESLAFSYYKKAAQRGHLAARYRMAVMYDAGIGVERNLQKAIREYGVAAAEGHLLAKTRLGMLALVGAVPSMSPCRGFLQVVAALPRRVLLSWFEADHPHIEP